MYFTVWHALRHTGRLVALDPRAQTTLTDGHYGDTLVRFARDSAPLTATSLVFLGALYALVPATPADLPELVGLYLVFIAALTLPHVLVVAWLDREQNVWTDRPALLVERADTN